MKTRIINLTAHESRAIQRGATILVREVKPQPQLIDGVWRWMPDKFRDINVNHINAAMAPYHPGDLLIGREAWSPDHAAFYPHFPIVYRAEYPSPETENGKTWSPEQKAWFEFRWRSAATMPKRLARVRRIVSAVSLKRCQDLTEGECEAMGYDGDCPVGHIPSYQAGKNTYHFAQANEKLWSENRFVWVTSVKEEE